MWVQLSTTCSNVLKQPNGELLVAVSHNQLRTMASDTVDPIDWSHPPPSWAVPLERLVHSINQCNLSAGTERATAACEATTLPMWPLRVYKTNNTNIKKFYDRTRSNILLFTLVIVGVSFFINIWASVTKISLSAYSHIIFYYSTRIHRK